MSFAENSDVDEGGMLLPVWLKSVRIAGGGGTAAIGCSSVDSESAVFASRAADPSAASAEGLCSASAPASFCASAGDIMIVLSRESSGGSCASNRIPQYGQNASALPTEDPHSGQMIDFSASNLVLSSLNGSSENVERFCRL